MLMEKAGTGGSIFRNLYRDFLKESFEILKIQKINEAYKCFIDIALDWKKVSDLFVQIGISKDIQYVDKAAQILTKLSEKEKKAMELLI